MVVVVDHDCWDAFSPPPSIQDPPPHITCGTTRPRQKGTGAHLHHARLVAWWFACSADAGGRGGRSTCARREPPRDVRLARRQQPRHRTRISCGGMPVPAAGRDRTRCKRNGTCIRAQQRRRRRRQEERTRWIHSQPWMHVAWESHHPRRRRKDT